VSDSLIILDHFDKFVARGPDGSTVYDVAIIGGCGLRGNATNRIPFV
jgi:hypothetical protein